MSIPGEFRVLVITLSDRAHQGVYEDRSGPLVRELLSDWFSTSGWTASIELSLIPDNAEILARLIKEAVTDYNLIFTTGGTGIGPRDITVDTIKPLLAKEIPGIMEMIRIKYGMDKPNALLSRSVAGLAGISLIYTLPGSVKAVNEYMTEILKTLKHTVFMQYGIDAHN
jgi:molybdenum cofactor synthesis domain-containing protein